MFFLFLVCFIRVISFFFNLKEILITYVLFEGCYPESTDLPQYVVKKTMIISSVGICQEICYQKNGYKFAVKVGNDKLVDKLFSFNLFYVYICKTFMF